MKHVKDLFAQLHQSSQQRGNSLQDDFSFPTITAQGDHWNNGSNDNANESGGAGKNKQKIGGWYDDDQYCQVNYHCKPPQQDPCDPHGGDNSGAKLEISKSASIDGGTANVAGEVISYEILVKNTGIVGLTNVVVTDPLASNLTFAGVAVGDADNILEPGETWRWTANHTVTQAELNSFGGGDGLIENTATADSDQTGPVSDNGDVLVEPGKVDLNKTASLADGGFFADEAGDIINYSVTVQNIGNLTLTGVVVNDSLIGPGLVRAPLDIVGDEDNLLEPGEVWHYTGSYVVTLNDITTFGGGNGLIENTATVTTDQNATDSDDAHVIVVERGPDATGAALVADEDDLLSPPADAPGNNDVQTGDDAPAGLTGDLGDFGPVGPGALTFDVANGDPVEDTSTDPVTSNGDPVLYFWDSATDTLYGTTDATDATAAAANAVFKIVVDQTDATYEFTLLNHLDHASGDDENNILIDVPYTIENATGSTDSDILSLNIDDDLPVPLSEVEGVSGAVLEDGLSTAIEPDDKSEGNRDGGQTTDDDATSGAAGSLAALFSIGADVPAVTSLSDDTSGLPDLYSKGELLTYAVTDEVGGDGVLDTLTASSSAGTVFTLTVNPDGSWNFDLDDQLDHTDANGDSGFDLRTAADGSTSVSEIDFSSIIVATDSDGDSVTGAAPNSFTIAVENDVPIAADCPELESGTELTGANPADLLYVIPPGQGLEIDLSDVISDAAFDNSVGYYFADAAGNPISGAILLDDAGESGDTAASVNIAAGDVPVGAVTLGFFIIPDGDDNVGLNDGDAVTFAPDGGGGWIVLKDGNPLDSAQDAILFSDRRLNPGDADKEQSGGARESNWEDKVAGTDSDFNDVQFNVHVCAPPAVTALVHEDALGQGIVEAPADSSIGILDNNGDGIDDVDPAADEADGAIGSLAALFSTGADEDLTFSLLDNTSGLPNLLSKGESVIYDVNGDTLTGYVESGVAGLDAADRVVFTLTVNPDGSWHFDLDDQLDHAPANGDTGTDLLVSGGGTVPSIDFSSIIVATDFDGDAVVGAAEGSFAIAVENDVPIAVSETEGVSGTVLEDGLSTAVEPDDKSEGNRDGGQTTDDDATSGAAGSLTALFQSGADEPVTTSLSSDTSGLPDLYSKGELLTYAVTDEVGGDGILDTLTASSSAGTVFTLTVNPDGSWNFDLDDQLDHTDANGDSGFDLRTAADGSTSVSEIDFSSIIVATDSDGDAVEGAAEGSFAIAVENDVPIAVSETEGVTGSVAEDALSTSAGDLGDLSEGNLDAGQNLGSDEASGVAGALSVLFSAGADEPLAFSLSDDTSGLPDLFSKGVQLTYAVTDEVGGDGILDTLTATGPDGTVFTLTVNTDGSWSFDLDDQLDHIETADDAAFDLVTSGGGSLPSIDFSSIIVATDADGDSVVGAAPGAFTVAVENDVPIADPEPNAITATVLEDALSTAVEPTDLSEGNRDGGQTTDQDTASGAADSLAALFVTGADEPLTFSLLDDTTSLPDLFTKGVQLTYAVTDEVGGDGILDTLTATGPDGTVFTLTVNTDGSWSFDLDDQLDHVDNNTDTGIDLFTGGTPVDAIDFSALIVATDADGNSVEGAAPNSFLITVENDVPTVDVAEGQGSVDDLALNLDETTDADGDSVSENGEDTYNADNTEVESIGLVSNGDDDDTGQNTVNGTDPIGSLTTEAGALSALFSVTSTPGSDEPTTTSYAFAFNLTVDGAATSLSATQPAAGGNPDADGGVDGDDFTPYVDPTIFLFQVDDQHIEGRVGGASGPVALTLTLNDPDTSILGDETITFEQILAIDHGDDGNDFDTEAPLTLLGGDGGQPTLDVTLTATVTDFDKDPVEDTASVTLIDNELSPFSIDDDGPTAPVVGTGEGDVSDLALNLDETIDPDANATPGDGADTYNADNTETESNGGPDNGDDDDTGQASVDGVNAIGSLTTAAGALAGLFAVGTVDAGTDGLKTTEYGFAFDLSTGVDGAATSLSATQPTTGGNPGVSDYLDPVIYLFQIDDHHIEGHVGNSLAGPLALTIELNDPDPAVLGDETITFEQILAIDHGDDGNDFDTEALLNLVGDATLGVNLAVTLTDGDTDEVVGEHAVTLIDNELSPFSIDDDGPTTPVVSAAEQGDVLSLALNLDETIDPDANATPGDGADNYNGAIAETESNGGPSNGDTDDTGQASVDGVNVIGSLTTTAGALAGLFSVGAFDAGTDGEKSVAYGFAFALSTGLGGAVTTLSATQPALGGNPHSDGVGGDFTPYADPAIYLFQTAPDTIEGHVGNSLAGPLALTITLNDPDPAVLGDETITFEQYLLIDHGDVGSNFDTEAALNLIGDATLGVNLAVTLTDGDTDTLVGEHSITLIDSELSPFSIDDDQNTIDLFIVGSNEDDKDPPIDDVQHQHVVPGPANTVGAINGDGGNDLLIGDPGGTEFQPGETANIILVLDSSGSMTSDIDPAPGIQSRMQALKDSVNTLIDTLAGSGADAIRVHIVDFDTNATSLGTFNLIVGGVMNAAAVTAAHTAVNAMTAGGFTDYEAGLQRAIDYIAPGGDEPLAGADVNQLMFVSDGEPNRAYSGDGTSTVDTVTTSQALGHLTGSGFDGDTVSEINSIIGSGFALDAVGVDVGEPALEVLDQVEGSPAGTPGHVSSNVTSPADLTNVLLAIGGGSTNPLAAGNDVINGADGDDILFGDAPNTDVLAAANALGTLPGTGWDVFDTLETSVGPAASDPAGDGVDWTRDDTIAYIKDNLDEIGQESGRADGNDTINAGEGDDIVYGQEGNDLITGGEGSDTMSGGTGADTFIYNATSEGTDSIIDLDITQGDAIQVDASAFGGGLVVGDASGGGLFGSSANATFGSGAERFHFDTSNNTLLYDADGSGAGSSAIALAVLENGGPIDGAHIKIVA